MTALPGAAQCRTSHQPIRGLGEYLPPTPRTPGETGTVHQGRGWCWAFSSTGAQRQRGPRGSLALPLRSPQVLRGSPQKGRPLFRKAGQRRTAILPSATSVEEERLSGSQPVCASTLPSPTGLGQARRGSRRAPQGTHRLAGPRPLCLWGGCQAAAVAQRPGAPTPPGARRSGRSLGDPP